jgi:SRSO17 transposase
MYLEGLVSGLERKSIEPIAYAHDVPRRGLQRFVGAGSWSDTAIRTEMRRHIVDEIGTEEATFVIDGSCFPKKGNDSVGVARQWCGRLGKVDNCQVGVFLGYSTPSGCTLVDAELFLPDAWAEDQDRRAQTHVPAEVTARSSWEIADELLVRHSAEMPHGWIVGDDEFGRPSKFRDRLAARGEKYLLEVPQNTSVRRPPDWPGRKAKWCTVAERNKHVPSQAWKRVTVRNGERGPIEVLAYSTRVETRRRSGGAREEVLLIMRSLDGAQLWYFLACKEAPVDETLLVRVAAHRHRIEEVFATAKGDAGLDHYEVRSWVGWHHHMTLSMLAVWFLILEHRRLEKKLRP